MSSRMSSIDSLFFSAEFVVDISVVENDVIFDGVVNVLVVATEVVAGKLVAKNVFFGMQKQK